MKITVFAEYHESDEHKQNSLNLLKNLHKKSKDKQIKEIARKYYYLFKNEYERFEKEGYGISLPKDKKIICFVEGVLKDSFERGFKEHNNGRDIVILDHPAKTVFWLFVKPFKQLLMRRDVHTMKDMLEREKRWLGIIETVLKDIKQSETKQKYYACLIVGKGHVLRKNCYFIEGLKKLGYKPKIIEVNTKIGELINNLKRELIKRRLSSFLEESKETINEE